MNYQTDKKSKHLQKPPWLARRLPRGRTFEYIRLLLKEAHLHTVCQEAKCPNIWECFSKQTATFLIMGPFCTRNCRFCAVNHGCPSPPDPDEPKRIAQAARIMKLRYCVITSVTRDDLTDGGARYFAETVSTLRMEIPDIYVEILIPDFQGNQNSLYTVINTRPAVLNHNIETVSRLYNTVRPQASYTRSLDLMRRTKQHDPYLPIKSGLMLGLGESTEEVMLTLHDLLNAGCTILTLSQYLQPTPNNIPVNNFIHPDEFVSWKLRALEMGFKSVASSPFVRSSYRAEELYKSALKLKAT